jgi:predicted lipid-binding transport protein (Tim44 family)
MALSMDEQRMLAEIERRLAAEDPGLATRLSSFRRPGPAAGLRTTRGKIIGSLCTVVLLAVIGLTVYAMIPFRAQGSKTPVRQTSAQPSVSAPARSGTAAGSTASPAAASQGTISGSTAAVVASHGQLLSPSASTGN